MFFWGALFFGLFFSFCSIEGFVFTSPSNPELTECAESTEFKGPFFSCCDYF